MTRVPYWARGAGAPAYSPLAGDITADAAVIGAGITGLTCALALREAGLTVAVLEMNAVGSGTTGHSTGHLDSSNDQGLDTIIGIFGEDGARTIMKAKRAAIDRIEQWDAQYDLQSGFKRLPAYQYAEDDGRGRRHVEQEAMAAERLGLPAQLKDRAPLPFPTQLALMHESQARFDPLKYLTGLARAFTDAGGALYGDTRAEHVSEEDGEVQIATNHGLVRARWLVLAGHTPLLGMLTLQPRSYPYQSYVLCVRVLNDVDDALYWDVQSPYHYTRLASNDDPHTLIIGGADHRTGEISDTESRFEELERYVRDRYDVAAIECRWSHEFFETADGAPFIGRVPGYEHVCVGAGYSGDGLTFGTAAGRILADLVQEHDHEALPVFDPSRIKPVASAKRIATGFLHMGRHFVGDRIAGGDKTDVELLHIGDGRLLDIDGETLAVYRDESAVLHVMSPVCRHMKCIVQWNAAEKTWDCPCHGGRYDATGNVIMGPPMKPLERRKLPQRVERP